MKTTSTIRERAFITLVNMPDPPLAIALRQEIVANLVSYASIVRDEKDAIKQMDRIRFLRGFEGFERDSAEITRHLEAVIRFLPERTRYETQWPQNWLDAGRLLGQLDFNKLQGIAATEGRYYLSAAGAAILASKGFLGGTVVGWLKNVRDYPFLSVAERQELRLLR